MREQPMQVPNNFGAGGGRLRELSIAERDFIASFGENAVNEAEPWLMDPDLREFLATRRHVARPVRKPATAL